MRCRICKKEKSLTDFPWLKSKVCRDCHLEMAINWDNIPWPEKKPISSKQRESLRKARTLRGKSLAISTGDSYEM